MSETTRRAKKKQTALAVIIALTPLVWTWLQTAISTTNGIAVTDATALMQAVVGLCVIIGLLVARYVYDVEQLPDEASVGVIVRVIKTLAKARQKRP